MKDMFYTIDKLRNRIHELDNFRYRDVIELEYFNTKLNEDKDIAPAIPQDFDGTMWHIIRGNMEGKRLISLDAKGS